MQMYQKAIVAFIVSALNVVRSLFGFDLGLDEATINTIVGAALTLGVIIFPNKKPDGTNALS